MLTRPEKKKEAGGDGGELKDVSKHEGDLQVLLFHSVITSSDRAVSLFYAVYEYYCNLSPLLCAASITKLQG